MSGENGEHIEVVRQLPIHVVRADIRAQVGWVDEEHYSRRVLVLLDEFLVVAGHHGDALEVVGGFGVVRFSYIVVERLLAHFGDTQFVLHREHQSGGDGNEVDVAVFALFLLQASEYLLSPFPTNAAVFGDSFCDVPQVGK